MRRVRRERRGLARCVHTFGVGSQGSVAEGAVAAKGLNEDLSLRKVNGDSRREYRRRCAPVERGAKPGRAYGNGRRCHFHHIVNDPNSTHWRNAVATVRPIPVSATRGDVTGVKCTLVSDKFPVIYAPRTLPLTQQLDQLARNRAAIITLSPVIAVISSR